MSKGLPYVDIRGYNQGVTGSCIENTVHFSSGETFRFNVDDGMYQGEGHQKNEYNDTIVSSDIDAILLTHTHLDHDGAMPIRVKNGYNKKIYMSKASECLIDIGLEDSYNIMLRDAKIKKRPILYSASDITTTLKQIEGCDYEKSIQIHPNITVTFFNNGHLVGSSIILVQIEEFAGTINLLYTGDYKPYNIFLDLKPLPSWVYALPNLTIITESTYGSTNSWDIENTWVDDIVDACRNNKTIINTAFGQGRFQHLMFLVRKLQEDKLIPKDYIIRVDGKTGIDYTFRYLSNCNILGLKQDMNFFPYNMQFIDNDTRPSVLSCRTGQLIIATSGMGSYGAAATYISHFLSNPNALIYFPGYTSEGTLGRKVLEAKVGEEVIFKDNSSVIKKASVLQTREFSSHATANELIDFINMFVPRSVLITHGNVDVKNTFEERVKKEAGVKKTGILGMGFVYRVDSYGIAKAVQK